MSDDTRLVATGRRAFLKAGGAFAGLGILGLTGCDTTSTEPQSAAGDRKPSGSGPKQQESPMLAEQVKRGKLPKLADRLPTKPMTVQPFEDLGDFGGEWRGALFYGSGGTERTVGYDFLARWHSDKPGAVPTAVPNIAARLEVSEDATEWTIVLRQGTKWSDGEPFTADDVVFAQNDILNNTDLTPVPPWSATAHKVDDVTVKLVFDPPDGLFLARQAGPQGNYLSRAPKHYLTQFHLKYNPDVKQMAEDADFDNWMALFANKQDWLANPDLPNLRAWKPDNAFGESDRLKFSRNPYYWKTDPQGRQLPYIDHITLTNLNSAETGVVQASQGDLDFVERTINTLQNKPVFARNRDKGDFRFFDRPPAEENFSCIALNLTHKDRIKRKVFRAKDFRIGLSYAINRPEIIRAVFKGLSEPWQVAPLKGSPYYDEGYAKQYTEHDVDMANRHLDKVLPDKNSSGVRLGPDGKPFVFQIDLTTNFYPEWTDTLELIVTYWKAVGIRANVKPMDRSLFYERKAANLHDANIWEGSAAFRDDLLLDCRWHFPFNSESNYATPWATWFTSQGKDGERPPAATRKQMQLYRQLEQSPDAAEQDRLMKQILGIAKEQFYAIGVNSFPETYGLATNRFRNVPTMLASWIYQPPGLTDPEQYFIEADQQ